MPGTTSFTFENAAEILSPDFQRAYRREIANDDAKAAHWRAEYERTGRGGTSWSGMGPGPAPQPRSDAARHAAAHKALAASDAWQASPEGRFHKAACLIAQATGDERLLNCATRGVAHEIDRARALLSQMEGPAAESCRAALDDFTAQALAAE